MPVNWDSVREKAAEFKAAHLLHDPIERWPDLNDDEKVQRIQAAIDRKSARITQLNGGNEMPDNIPELRALIQGMAVNNEPNYAPDGQGVPHDIPGAPDEPDDFHGAGPANGPGPGNAPAGAPGPAGAPAVAPGPAGLQWGLLPPAQYAPGVTDKVKTEINYSNTRGNDR